MKPVPDGKTSEFSKALVVRDARDALMRQVPPAKVGEMLLVLPVEARAMTVAAAFNTALDQTIPSDVDAKSESMGRYLERALEETGKEQEEVIESMIRSGDIHCLLSMVKGEAGNYSSTAEHLTPPLIQELFDNDSDMNDADRRTGRLIHIAYTLIVETSPLCEGINNFFNSHEGYDLLREMSEMYAQDEDVVELFRMAEGRGIRVPQVIIPDDGIIDEDKDSADEACA